MNRRDKLKERQKAKGGNTSMIYKQFSSAEVHERSQIFNLMNHSGNTEGIDFNDIKQSWGDLGVNKDDKIIQTMMKGQERITFPQFLTFLKGDQVADKKDDIVGAFSVFAADGSDSIDANLLMEILTDRSFENPIDRSVVEDLIASVPKSRSNKIVYETIVDVLKIGAYDDKKKSE